MLDVETFYDLSEQLKQSRLKLDDKLSIIRTKLDVGNDLLFSKRISNQFANIAFECEDNYLLDEVIEHDANRYLLYLSKSSLPHWKFFNGMHRLDYGSTMTFNGIKKASKRALVMKDCEMTPIGVEGYRKGRTEFKSCEDWMMMKNLFFTSDIHVKNFVRLGMSGERSHVKSFNLETESTYSYDYVVFSKVSLRFGEWLIPTQEFVSEVKRAKTQKDLMRIFEEYGQFVPTGILLGGRVSSNDSDSVSSSGNSTYCNSSIVGGQSPNNDLEEFDENGWIKSLRNYRTWVCVEFRDPICIFRFLDDDLQKRIFEILGKKILYSTVEEREYGLSELGTPKELTLTLPKHVSEIFHKESADCNVFATVIGEKEVKNEFFHCQIQHPSKGEPKVIIHCVQKRFKKRKFRLKIEWMVIGYDINFNSIDFDVELNLFKKEVKATPEKSVCDYIRLDYDPLIKKAPCIGISVLDEMDPNARDLVIGHHFFCDENVAKNELGFHVYAYSLEGKQYVDLPFFTFYTLVILKYPISDAYGIKGGFRKSQFNFPHSFGPKYISFYSTLNVYEPIFLKQKANQIKIKYIGVCHCKEKTECICKSRTFKKSKELEFLKYAFFDPKIDRERRNLDCLQ